MVKTVAVGKKSKNKVLLEKVAEDGSSSFARALGSVDFHTREQGLRALGLFLQKSSKLERLSFLKLWKGIFYCFWHSDKAPVQNELAMRLAASMDGLQPEVALQYFGTFLETMKREWFGIDRLRLDKFMLLVRKFIQRMLATLQSADWDAAVASQYTDLLRELLISSAETTSQGLSLQIIDVLIPELLGLLEETGEQITHRQLCMLIQPFLDCITQTQSSLLQNRIRDSLLGPILEALANLDENEPLSNVSSQELSSQLFNLGAQAGLKAGTREMLYSSSNQFGALEAGPRNSHNQSAGKRKKLELSAPAEAPEPSGRKTKKVKSITQQGGGESAGEQAQYSTQIQLNQAKAPNGVSIADGVSQAANPDEPGGNLPSAKKLKKLEAKAARQSSLNPEEVHAAAERTISAIEALKRGETTIHPATPGSPRLFNFENLFSQTLEEREQEGSSPRAKETRSQATDLSGTANHQASGNSASKAINGGPSKSLKQDAPGKSKGKLASKSKAVPGASGAQLSTPQPSSKHVKIALKKNLYFEPGSVKPSPDLRTPISCRPKGSALKSVGKYPWVGVDGRKVGSPKGRGSQTVAVGEKKKGRRSNLGPQNRKGRRSF